jgi:hypothetical protein
MVKGNIAAWTPERKNPPYVSINHVYRFTPMIEIVVMVSTTPQITGDVAVRVNLPC